MKKKEFFRDSIFNIISSIIPILILQLFLFPLLANFYEPTTYGQFLTLISLFNLCPAVLGLSLNNYTLLKSEDSKPSVYCMLRNYLILNTFIISVFTLILFKTVNFYDLIFTVVISNLWLLHDFLIVYFQKNLKYFSLLINTFVLSIGYYGGYLLFLIVGKWQMIYFIGFIFSLVHIIYLNKEIIYDFIFLSSPTNKTASYYKRDINQISLAALMIRLTTYADRLLLFPLIGGQSVAVYYASSFTSKIIAMAINPISAVILAYLSKINNVPKKIFNIYILIVSSFCFLSYFFIVKISKYVLNIVYPSFYPNAEKLIPFSTIAILLYVIISIINPLVLKYKEIKWQFIINLSNLIIYLFFSLISLLFFGLRGFAISIIITNSIKIIFLLLILNLAQDI